MLTIFGLLYSHFSHADVSHSTTSQKKAKSAAAQLHQKKIKTNPITDNDSENTWTANIESYVYQAGTFENITIGYSTVSGWDFSVALLNTQVLGNDKHFQGDIFFNIAKIFEITDKYSAVIGTQNGISLANVQPRSWYSFTFMDNRYYVKPWLLLHGGVYLANAALTGTSRQVGFMAGTEITFIPNKLFLQMDYISGHHSLSGGTVNMAFNVTPRWQVYMGVYVPEQDSGNEFAGIIGFNFSTSDL